MLFKDEHEDLNLPSCFPMTKNHKSSPAIKIGEPDERLVCNNGSCKEEEEEVVSN